MRSILKNTITSLAACLAMTGTLCFAQANTHAVSGVISDNAAGQVVLKDTVGRAVASPFSARAFTTLEWGELPGVPNDQYTVGAFVPFHVDPGTSLFFSELSGTVTDQGKGVFNGGFGWRYYMESRDRMFGLGGWFTNDGRGAEDFNAVGFHMESVGRWFNLRLNGSFLTDEDAQLVSRTFLPDESYQGNNIVTTQLDYIEIPVNQLEMMFEAPAPIFGKYGVNWGIGPYHYYNNSQDIETTGTKVNFHSQWTEDMWVDVDYQKDSFFGQKTMVSVTFMLPHRRSNRWFRQTPIRERLGNPVDRPRNIPFSNDVIESSIALTSICDGETLRVVHIDPNAAVNGDGTFESPFNNLASFVNDPDIDIIRIIPRDDNTTSGLQMSSGLDLFDCQWLVSSHVAHVLETVEKTIFLPGQTDHTEGAWIQNVNNAPGDYVVSLANHNYVSGLKIDSSGIFGEYGNGIVSQAPGIEDFHIDRNNFFNHQYAIVLNEVAGTGLLTDNIIDGSNLDDDDLQVGPGIGGFMLTNTGNFDLDLVASGNDIKYHSGTGYDVTASDGTIDHSFTNNTVQENETGASVTATDDAVINNIIDNNSILNNTGDSDESAGLRVIASAGGQQNIYSLFGNDISDNAGNGALLSADTGGIIYAEGIYNNSFSNNDLNGFSVVSEDIGSSVEVYLGMQDAEGTLLPNVLDGNGAAGANFLASELGVIMGRLENNEFTNNTGSGVLVTAEFGGEVDFGNGGAYGIIDNEISDNGEYGVGLFAIGDDNPLVAASRIDADFYLNNIEDNDSVGIYGFGSGLGDSAYLDINAGALDAGNNIEGNGNAGVGVFLTDNATADLDIFYNEITDSTSGSLDPYFDGEGVAVRLDGNSELLSFYVMNNLIDGNSGNGVFIETYTQSIMETENYIVDNEITNNDGDGVRAERYGESILDNVYILGNELTGNNDGVRIDTYGGSLDFRDGFPPGTEFVSNFYIGSLADEDANNISNNDDEGIDLRATADSHLNVDVYNNLVNDNGGDGLSASIGYFAALTGTWTQNEFNRNNFDGIWLYEGDFVQTHTGSYNPFTRTFSQEDTGITVDIYDNELIDNGARGLHIEVTSDVLFSRNIVTGSGQSGIRLNVPGGQQNPLNQVAPSLLLTAEENLIADNGVYGVEFRNIDDVQGAPPEDQDPFDPGGLLVATLYNNDILRNGNDGVFSVVDSRDITLVDSIDNRLIENAGYGYRILTHDDDRHVGEDDALAIGVDGGEDYNQNVNDGTDNSSGTGIARQRFNISGTGASAVATQGDGTLSRIDNNGLGGILLENSTMETHAFNIADEAISDTDFRLLNTAIRGNGNQTGSDIYSDIASPDDANGLYIRVGTVDYVEGTLHNIFENDNIPPAGQVINPVNFDDLGDENSTTTILSEIGTVDADIRGNYFSGNLNSDVVIQSFVETPQRGHLAADAGQAFLTASGDYNGNFHADPKAVLNLRFEDNVGESIDVTRQGAWFDNDDPFKSPASVLGDNPNTSRRRNAQREDMDVYLGSSTEVAFGTQTVVIDPLPETDGDETSFTSTGAADNTLDYTGFNFEFTTGALTGTSGYFTSSGEGANAGEIDFVADAFGLPGVGDEFDLTADHVFGDPSDSSFSAFGTPGFDTDDDAYLNTYVIFTSGANAFDTRRITGSEANASFSAAVDFTTDAFDNDVLPGDQFDLWALQVAGVGESTFRVEGDIDLDLSSGGTTNGNFFDYVISDFDGSFVLGAAPDENYPFYWRRNYTLPGGTEHPADDVTDDFADPRP